MSNTWNHLKAFRFILIVFTIGLILFSLVRLVLLFTELDQLSNLPDKWLIVKALGMGVRFDTVISCYILSLPTVLLGIASIFSFNNKLLFNSMSWFIVVLYSVAFFITVGNIPYFNYYFAHINAVAFAWTDTPDLMLGMVFNKTYVPFIILAFVLVVVFAIIVNKLKKKILFNAPFPTLDKRVIFQTIITFVLCVLLIIGGARGRLSQKSPIRIGTAYFSSYAFPNQLGLNPVYVFLRSLLDLSKEKQTELNLMDNTLAISNAQAYLGIEPTMANLPMARYINSQNTPTKYNVVIVLLESMTAANMERYGNKNNLTPHLDSLAKISYCFDNFYSAGIHTYNGIFSTLFSHPALLGQHPLKRVTMDKYAGISHILKENNYQTMFFTTYDSQFDNMEGFLRNNAFDQMYSQQDYPSDKVLSVLGVPDDYLLNYSLNEINKKYKDSPFLSVMLTSSNHTPIIIPTNIPFVPKSKELQFQAVEYSDWAVGDFMNKASKQAWFDNTIFVFTGDHGAVVGTNVYDMPLSYNHIPLLIYAPQIIKPQIIDTPGGQIDIFPTVMGILNIPYFNNTLGVDLIKEKRPCFYFSADDKIACIEDEFVYIYRKNSGIESLYSYRENEVKDYLQEYPEKADSLRTYAFSMLQTSQWMLLNGATGNPTKE